jgi:hypothetical protein
MLVREFLYTFLNINAQHSFIIGTYFLIYRSLGLENRPLLFFNYKKNMHQRVGLTNCLEYHL